VHFAGQELPAQRVVRPTLTPKQAEEYAGDYHSGELGVVYTVCRRDDRLMIRCPRGLEELRPVSADAFEAPYPPGQVTFARRVGRLAVRRGRLWDQPLRPPVAPGGGSSSRRSARWATCTRTSPSPGACSHGAMRPSSPPALATGARSRRWGSASGPCGRTATG